MPLSDNPDIVGIMTSIEMLLQDSEEKARRKEEKVLEEERFQRGEQAGRQRAKFGLVTGFAKDPSVTPESRGKMFDAGLEMLKDPDFDVSGGPEFKQTQEDRTYRLPDVIAKYYDVQPGNNAFQQKDYLRILQDYRDNIETERHHRVTEQKKPGGGLTINVGGRKTTVDAEVEHLEGLVKQANQLFQSGFTAQDVPGEEGGEAAFKEGVSRKAYERWIEETNDVLRRLKSGRPPSPQLLERLSKIKSFPVQESGTDRQKSLTDQIKEESEKQGELFEKFEQSLKDREKFER